MSSINFSYMVFRAQNISIPRNHTLLSCGILNLESEISALFIKKKLVHFRTVISFLYPIEN